MNIKSFITMFFASEKIELPGYDEPAGRGRTKIENLFSVDRLDVDGRRKALIVFGLVVDRLDDVHSLAHFPKSSITLPVRVIFAAVIETGLIADTDKELRSPGTGF